MRSLLSVGGIFLSFALAGLLRVVVFPPSEASEQLLEVPAFDSPGMDVMSILSAGHPEGAAALLWLRTIQYIGTNDEERLRALGPAINSMAQLTTDTDPLAYTVYWAAATVLTVYAKSAERSNRLLQKAKKHLPPRWELLALEAYNAFFLERDGDRAALLYAQAAQLPRAPRFLSSLAGRARSMASGPDAAIAMLERLIPSLAPGPQRDDAMERMKLAQREKLLLAYDEACTRFLQREGSLPSGPETLNQLGEIQAPTQDAFGHPIEFEVYQGEGPRSGSCVARTEEVPRRDFEVAAEILAVGVDE